jgi:hypothetical protein
MANQYVKSPTGDQKGAGPIAFPRKGHEGALQADGPPSLNCQIARVFPFLLEPNFVGKAKMTT